MIKCNVTINATIARNGEFHQLRDGGSVFAFPIKVTLPAFKGDALQQEISVSCDVAPFDTQAFASGKRIEVSGELTFRKRGDHVYVNLAASSYNFASQSSEDKVVGSMSFRGGVGKNIEERTDKKGNPMLMFTAFSTEKTGETFEYLWVRFLGFNMGRPEWLQPKAKAEVTGELELTAYEGRLSLGCRISEVKEYVKPPYYADNNRD